MNDWRLCGQERYLLGVTLSKAIYKQRAENWDHDHCEFCTAKFSEREKDLHEGYATEDKRHWICESCYEDFRDRFQWQLSAD